MFYLFLDASRLVFAPQQRHWNCCPAEMATPPSACPNTGLSVAITVDSHGRRDSGSGTMEVVGPPGSALSPQSEAVTNELQELTLQPAPNLPPLKERKNVLQLKLQQRRTREELVSQGIMPPLKSPAAFHEQRRSLERARTEDYLKRKIRSRPERSELVRMHILEETSAEPSLQAKQLQLKRARLADDLNDKISHRPGPIELVHKNILSVDCPLQHSLLDSPKGAGGESSSLDEDSSDALSPDQLTNHDSPLSAVTQLSPSDVLTQSRDAPPSQFFAQPPPPPPPLVNGSDSSPLRKITNGAGPTPASSRPSSGLKSQGKMGSDRPAQRLKKSKDSKPKVKKLKYHQYIPPDQKADKERPPQMDSSYAKLLHQQQLFLQLQILCQQQQHYNYHTILPAPPKPQNELTSTTGSGPSTSRSVHTTTSAQSSTARQAQAAVGGAKPANLPVNLDEFKVAELKQELKLRGLTVSGTKNDLIERLRHYQEQNGAASVALKSAASQPGQRGSTPPTPDLQAAQLALSSLAQAVPGRIMRFGSTSSSPPVSPTPSERSLAGLSPDETSCSGDMFGEMVSSPLTQLTLHPSPQQPSNVSSLVVVKEEVQSCCSLAGSSPTSAQPADSGTTVGSASLDKDQMLQEKDKQIEELTRMLRQKQRLVETLRSQLEQGKTAAGVVVKKEGSERSTTSPSSVKAPAIQPPTLPNGIVLTLKKEAEPAEGMEGVTEEAAGQKKVVQPMQCSQETLLRLQQIQRLQVQQAEQQQKQQQQQVVKVVEVRGGSQKQLQQKKEAQSLLQQQQQHLQRLIIQQTQQKQLQQNQLRPVQHKVQLKQVQVQIRNQSAQKPGLTQAQQRKLLRAQQRQKQRTAGTTQQATPLIVNQQNGAPPHSQAISLDLLKANSTPTLVTDGNGNHYLIALTSHGSDGPNGVSSLAKAGGRITLQRLQSTPSKLPSTDSQSNEQSEAEPVRRSEKKGLKPGLHIDTNGAAQPSTPLTAPPTLQPFFNDLLDAESQSSLVSSLKENGLNNQQMDDLFDILLKSGEIPSFKANPDPSLAPPHSDPPSPSDATSPLHLSSPAPPPSLPSPHRSAGENGSRRLEDFLEGGTGGSLLGLEPDGGLALMDDLHCHMLSAPGMLDHPPSPMDTSDLGFSPHSSGLDFGDPTLDSMDWLDLSMGGSAGGESRAVREGGGAAEERDGGTSLAPLAPHTPQSVFSTDFLDSADLQLHWESCL
uniref:Myocardin related transcription factor Ab n=1 Tax=Oryzias latipes TaxID=8090 RepID=A0A3P9LYS9_ORYLA